MPSPTQRRGGLAEDQAVLFLRRRGYEILGRHITSRYGEIDILARDGHTIVAVEVKYRRSSRFGTARESVTSRKIANIAATLAVYCEKNTMQHDDIRIDLIETDGDRVGHIIGIASE